MATSAWTRFISGKWLKDKFGEAIRNTSGYRRYGLVIDDLIPQSREVDKALQMLPPRLLWERQMRLKRAMDLSLKGEMELPKSMWTKPEEDVRYLRPFLEQVQRHKQELEQFRN